VAGARAALGLALAAVALAAAAASAEARPVARSAVLVQSADAASLSARGATRDRVLLLAGADPRVLAIADRPSRQSGELPPAHYLRLWRGPFRADPPNAALVGTRPDGERVRVPLVLRDARPTAGGMRYRARPLVRTPALELTGVSLLIDDVAIGFDPDAGVVTAPPAVVVTTGAPLVLDCTTPTSWAYATLTLQPTATIVLQEATQAWIRYEGIFPPGMPIDQLATPSAPSGIAYASFRFDQNANAGLWQLGATPTPNPNAIVVQAYPQIALTTATISCS
jgi:hypothetical protein